MTALPKLPEPYDGMLPNLNDLGKGIIDGYSAEQMRSYALAALEGSQDARDAALPSLVELQELIFDPSLDAGIELTKQLEPILRDAARYRFLREHAMGDAGQQLTAAICTLSCTAEQMDAAIDAALASAKG
jgi:hypothetical protein